MNSDTASSVAGKRVMTEEEAIAFLNVAILQNSESCVTLRKPGAMMMESGYQRSLGHAFYYQDSLNLCFLAILSVPCPAAELSDGDATSLYRAVLKSCNPRNFDH